MSSSRIAIIALDMNINDLALDKSKENYLILSEDKQLKRIEERIRYIGNKLKTKEPNAMWIIAWREYGITNGTQTRHVSFSAKKLLKKPCKNLKKNFILTFQSLLARSQQKSISKIQSN